MTLFLLINNRIFKQKNLGGGTQICLYDRDIFPTLKGFSDETGRDINKCECWYYPRTCVNIGRSI